MFSLTSGHQYYLYNGSTDMRKSFDGLSGLVQTELQRNPMSGEVFIFINKRRNKIKLLHWEHGGFILYYKRLERGTFEKISINTTTKSCYIEWSSLVMMIEGISIKHSIKRKRYLLKSGEK